MAIAFILAAAVPIFSDLIGITASVFASWYTYGIAGFFFLYDTYYLNGGKAALKRRWRSATLAVVTIVAGSFICAAGTYVSVKVGNVKLGVIVFWPLYLMLARVLLQLIVDAYRNHLVGKPFTC